MIFLLFTYFYVFQVFYGNRHKFIVRKTFKKVQDVQDIFYRELACNSDITNSMDPTPQNKEKANRSNQNLGFS